MGGVVLWGNAVERCGCGRCCGCCCCFRCGKCCAVLMCGWGELELRRRPQRPPDTPAATCACVCACALEQVLFNASIGYNIRYGRTSATDEEVEEAARVAHIHDAITHRFPGGWVGGRLVGSGWMQRRLGWEQQVWGCAIPAPPCLPNTWRFAMPPLAHPPLTPLCRGLQHACRRARPAAQRRREAARGVCAGGAAAPGCACSG